MIVRTPEPRIISLVRMENDKGEYGFGIGPCDEVKAALNSEDIPLLFFVTNTFNFLNPKESDEKFLTAFTPILYFFESLTLEEAILVAQFYIDMHKILLNAYEEAKAVNKITISHVNNFTNLLSKRLRKLDIDIDLANKLRSIVNTYIPIKPHEYNRARLDNNDITFYEEEIADLTSIVLLSKLMAPIYGKFMDLFTKKAANKQDNNPLIIEQSLRELYYSSTLTDVLSDRYFELVDKLREYILNATSKRMNNIDELTFALRGCTTTFISEHYLATLLNKSFATIDLFKDDCNLMYFITSCIKPTGNQKLFNFSKSTFIKSVEELRESGKSIGEEGNTTLFEVESTRSSHTADIYTLVKFATDNLVAKELEQLKAIWWLKDKDKADLIDDTFNRSSDYYIRNLIGLNDLSEFLIGLFYGRYIGGSSGINNLSVVSEAQLLTLTQLRTIYYGFPNVAKWCSTSIAVHHAKNKSTEDNLLTIGWKNEGSFKAIADMNPYPLSEGSWTKPIEYIVEELVTFPLTDRSAPAMLTFMGEEAKPNQLFKYDIHLPGEMLNVVLSAIADAKVDKY